MKILTTLLLLMIGCTIYSQYHPDRHNTSYDKGWISCDTNESPNPKRGMSHWVMYDFGQIYHLGETTIWNTNYSDNTNMGVKIMAIDYSTDGQTWLEFEETEIPEATASSFYSGVEGPDLTGIEAKFILITAVSNYGGSCSGFSEIRFNTAGIVSDVTEIDELDGDINISPNPIDNVGRVTFSNIEPGDYIIQISNLTGRIIQRRNISISSDHVEEDLDVTDITSGLYTLTIYSQRKLKSKTFEIIN